MVDIITSENFMFEKLFSVICMLFERFIPKRECKVNSSLTKQNKFKSQRDWYTPELGGLKNKVFWYLEVQYLDSVRQTMRG